MSDTSPRLALPYLQPAQAQKHVTHNEALTRLDVLVQLSVEALGATTPPGTPPEGAVWGLGAAPTGDWAGQAGALAAFVDGGWLFFAPAAGWRAWDKANGALMAFDGAAWTSTGGGVPDLDNLDGVGIGTSSDPINRLAVASQATLLSHAGAGHQLKVNKAATGDTASLMFQSGWSGRAEMGLAGGDDFSIKVSPDGSAFATALQVEAASGRIAAPGGMSVPFGSAAAPGLAFAGDSDTGLSRPASNQIALSTGGLTRAMLGDTELTVEVPTRIRFDGSPAFQDTVVDSTLFLVRSGTAAKDAYGPSIGFSRIGASNRVSAVISSKQTSTDSDQGGLSFFTHPSPNTGSALVEQMVIRHDGNIGVGLSEPAHRLDVAGTVQAANLRIAGSQVYAQGNILGAVSQTGGVPTGAVIERGSAASGNFVRFADGTMICTSAAVSVTNCSTAEGALFTSATATWTYPAAFAAAPVVRGSVDAIDCWLATGTPGTGSATMRVKSALSKTGALPVRLVATGRWF